MKDGIWTYKRLLAAAGYLVGFAMLLLLLGKLVVYFKAVTPPQGTWYPDSFHKHQPLISWDLTGPVRGEMPDTFQRMDIEKAYTEAWHAANLYLSSGIGDALPEYFADSLAAALVRRDAPGGPMVRRTDISHQLHPSLFTPDGQLIAFEDRNIEILTSIQDEGQFLQTVQNARVVMTLDDGRWRIRHLQMTAVQPDPATPIPSIDGRDRTALQHILGINYYPASSPWIYFWDDFDGDTIQKDMERIRSLGMNTVRFFIPFAEFGGGRPTAERMEQLGIFLDLASANQLQVIPTLFDFPRGYELSDYAGYNRYLKTILSGYGHHPSILVWDLKNEPDRDFEIHGKEKVLNWLEYMVGKARRYAPDAQFTVGWSTASAATHLYEQLDLVSFHYYDDLRNLPDVMANLAASVDGKPIMLQETGRSSAGLLSLRLKGGQKNQAAYIRNVLEICEAQSIPLALWTLYDFRVAPSTVFGWKPWIRRAQLKFGIYDTEGHPKKSREAFQHSRNSQLD